MTKYRVWRIVFWAMGVLATLGLLWYYWETGEHKLLPRSPMPTPFFWSAFTDYPLAVVVSVLLGLLLGDGVYREMKPFL